MKTQKALSLKKETVEILQSKVYGFGGAGTNQINSKAAGTICISCDRPCDDSKGQEFCQTKPLVSAEGTCLTCGCPVLLSEKDTQCNCAISTGDIRGSECICVGTMRC